MQVDIKLIRVERDCPFNIERRNIGEKNGIIYDFMVVIDGEKRGVFSKSGHERGYTLLDAARRPVPHKPNASKTNNYERAKVISQDGFIAAIDNALRLGVFPTVAECEAWVKQQELDRERIKAERNNELYVQHVNNHGVALREAVVSLLATTGALSPRAHELMHLTSREHFDQLQKESA